MGAKEVCLRLHQNNQTPSHHSVIEASTASKLKTKIMPLGVLGTDSRAAETAAGDDAECGLSPFMFAVSLAYQVTSVRILEP